MMSEAQSQAQSGQREPWLNADGSHKYGTHPDGTPKKAAGRPRKSPSLDDLKAAREQAEPESAAAPAADRAPDDKGRRRGRRGEPKPPPDVPQHRPGIITRGMNKRYRQVGKAVRALDRDIGQAFIEAARNTADPVAEGQEPEDNSVGAAWDDLARANPRIRRFCLAMIQGGAWGALVLAHAPIGVAIAMKFVSQNPGFIGRAILSMAEPDEDTPAGEGGLPFGMTAADAQDLMKAAGKLMPGMADLMGQQQQAQQQAKPPYPFTHGGAGSRRQPKQSSRASRRAG